VISGLCCAFLFLFLSFFSLFFLAFFYFFGGFAQASW